MAVEIRLMGPVTVLRDGRAVDVGGPKQRTVLAVLALSAGRRLSTERLVDLVWSEDPPVSARRTMQSYVASLRGSLGSDAPLTPVRGGYVFEISPDTVDLLRFENAVVAALVDVEVDPAAAATVLEGALDEWDVPCDGLRDGSRLGELAAPFEELQLQAVEGLAAAQIAGGQAAAAVRMLEGLVREHPTREHLWLHLAQGLARSGRRDAALAAIQRAREALREHLGVDLSDRLTDFEANLLTGDLGPGTTSPALDATAGRHNLPSEGSSFHGRRDDVARVVESLSGARLVTLVGPGGTGKTRMAIEAGLEMVDAVRDGVWFVDLASSDSLSDVWRELAATLPLSIVDSRLPPRDVVLADLKARQAAIILDNCEHVIDAAAAVVSELSAAAPAVRVLATSRVPLHLRAEMVIRLQPLPTPPRDAQADEAAHSPSVELFTRRAHAAGHAEFTPEDVVVVGEICRRLDGLPLAIELVAAMTSVSTPTQIVERLASGSADVVSHDRDRPRRHASLTDTVMWSYDLLSDVERQVFVRLAIFAGGFEFADAVEVCSDQHISKAAVSDALVRLIDASLVIPVRRDKTNRYTMLDTVRTLAARLLADTPSLDDLSRRHAEQFLALADSWYDWASGPEERDWLRLLESNRPNLRQAFEWWLLHDAERAQLLAGSLLGFWRQRNLVSEAVETLQAALDASSTMSAGRLRAQFGFGSFVIGEDPKAATEIFLEVVESAEHLGLQHESRLARMQLGLAAMLDDDPERAQAAFEETYQWASRVGEYWCVAVCCMQLAYLSLIRQEFETARSLVSEGFAAAERSGSSYAIATGLETQGWVELAAGRLDDARRAFAGALSVEDKLGPTLDVPVRLGMAAVAFAAGDLPATVRHTQDALSHLEEAQVFYSSHVDYLLQIAACIHSSSGDLDRAAALKGLISRQTVWSRRGPMSGWIAAIDEMAGALTIEYPTRLDQLREILALEEAIESD